MQEEVYCIDVTDNSKESLKAFLDSCRECELLVTRLTLNSYLISKHNLNSQQIAAVKNSLASSEAPKLFGISDDRLDLKALARRLSSWKLSKHLMAFFEFLPSSVIVRDYFFAGEDTDFGEGTLEGALTDLGFYHVYHDEFLFYSLDPNIESRVDERFGVDD